MLLEQEPSESLLYVLPIIIQAIFLKLVHFFYNKIR